MKRLVLFKILDIGLGLGALIACILWITFTSVPIIVAVLVVCIPIGIIEVVIEFRYRCPYCKVPLGVWRRWISYKHCPHCGKEFPKEM